MNVADHIRLSQREKVSIVQEILRRVLEAAPPDVRFLHSISADGRAHRPINDGDPTFKYLLQRMLMGFCHIFLMALSVANLPADNVTFSCNGLISIRCAGTQKGLVAFALVFLGHALESAKKPCATSVRH